MEGGGARVRRRLSAEARDRFQQAYRTFELKETDDLETTGRQLVARLEGNPGLLLILRGGKLAADGAVVIAVIAATWVPSWYHLLLIPLGVSATHQSAELVARGGAEAARMKVRHDRETLVQTTLTAPLADWLGNWPATGGSAFERLQQVLARVPQLIRELEERVRAKLGG